ncbi:SelB C-terminal domain-containing protein [Streptomyces tricolor]|nr:SelB C-terminal domain-containing protein [Streptomyces tricolor]
MAAAAAAGALLRIADGIVLLPGADADAAAVLRALPQPFTLSEARRALDTTRRVAVPLLGSWTPADTPSASTTGAGAAVPTR